MQGILSLTTTQLCHWSRKVAMNQQYAHEWVGPCASKTSFAKSRPRPRIFVIIRATDIGQGPTMCQAQWVYRL